MFDMPYLGTTASYFVLQESRNAELLEEVDEEDIIASVSPIHESPDGRLLFVFISSLAALLSALSAAYAFHVVVAVIAIFVVFGLALWLLIRWRLRTLVRTMKKVEVSAQKTNRALLQREALSFGLGLPPGRLHSSCRLRLFLNCREMVHLLNTLAEQLVTSPFMFDEKRRLVNSFYTEEMNDLVYSPADLESPHITQRGIGTLLDLFVLHRSEVLRLIVLYLSRAPFLTSSLLIFQLIFSISSHLNAFVSRFDVLQNTLSQRSRDRPKSPVTAHELRGSDGIDKVLFSLDDIVTGITNRQLSTAEVKRALQRILLMDVFCESGIHPSAEEDRSSSKVDRQLLSNDKPNGPAQIPESASLRDEVYEVIASPDDFDGDDASFGDDADFAVQRESRQLMEELRAALAGRATEFAARERRALAAFYGVSDDELERIEKANEKNELVAESQEFSSDDIYVPGNDNDETSEEAQPRSARVLPSDLLAALRLRAVAEETIGDD